MTEFVPRSGWADSDWSRGGARLTGSKLRGCANHWPGTTTSAYGVESRNKVRARIRGWWGYHVNGRGWSDIGYGVAFDQAGRVWDLRGIGRVGAHSASASNPDANHEWTGCLFILGANEQPTLAMVAAYQEWRRDVFLKRWPGRTDMTGHGRAPGVRGAQTTCPGPRVAALITDGTLKQSPEDGMAWDHRGYDFVNDDPVSKDFQLAKAHEYAFELRYEPRVLARGVTRTDGVLRSPSTYAHRDSNEHWTLERYQREHWDMLHVLVEAHAGRDVTERLDAIHAEIGELSSQLEAAEAERADLAQLVRDAQSGELSVDQLLDALGARLVNDDSEAAGGSAGDE